jgi:copper transport protein
MAVTFVFSNPAAAIEPFRRRAEISDDGPWRADGVVLPLPGKWTVRIDVLITDFEIARLEGEISIKP